MLVQLSNQYQSRFGAPVISQIDVAIFSLSYYTYCLSCDFCQDSCCQYGADIDLENIGRLDQYQDALVAFTGVSRDRWFASELEADEDYPGGQVERIRPENGRCVFLNRQDRGCRIHSFCLEQNMDYHLLKPIICSLFPLSFESGVLCPAYEVEDGELACLGSGPSLYQGGRSELLAYFGQEFVNELDELEKRYVSAPQQAAETPFVAVTN
jgi:Fe-S-cluster containining protein